jgi:hypothetical protein
MKKRSRKRSLETAPRPVADVVSIPLCVAFGVHGEGLLNRSERTGLGTTSYSTVMQGNDCNPIKFITSDFSERCPSH